jgi:2-polyprenyl-6-methoxyphenol hydroxylase-like FAD-dependent oxidoreductase
MHDTPVLIVGGGSVGLSLAAELGWRGIACVLVERAETLNMHPRANAVANRTMEYYRRYGIDQAITDAGIPPDLPANYCYVTTLAGRLLHGINLPPFTELNKAAGPGGYAREEHTWSPYLKTITGQHEVEKVLLRFVAACDCVTLKFSTELVSFEQSPAGVSVRLRGADGQAQALECAYLIACDGGRSRVRHELDIGLEGRAELARFVSVYFRAPGFNDAHAFGHANIFFPLHRDHRGFLLNWDGGSTFTYHVILEDGQDWQSVDPKEAIQGLLGQPIEVDVLSVQPWTAHALVAERYRDGRVFLAGDAAHLFSPTGGFGMNTGVSDAVDLAWKVQACLDGWGGARLLDSYEVERKSIGLRNTMEAADCFDRLYAVMQDGDVIDADGAQGDAARARLKALIIAQDKLIVSSGTLLGYRYEGSGIIVNDGTPEPADDPRHYVAVARPGHRAPHVWLDDGTSLLDRFGQGFTLLVTGPVTTYPHDDVRALSSAAAALAMPLEVVVVEQPEVAARYAARLILIRPDLMVAWRDDTLSRPAWEILDVVRGA